MKRSLWVLALFAFSNTAPADTAGYSYVRAGYTVERFETTAFDIVELAGTAIDFSMALSEHWALTASHYSTDEETVPLVFNSSIGVFLPVQVAHEFASIGALYHRSLPGRIDLLASLESGAWEFWFVDDYFETGINNQDENGYRLSLGLRSIFFERLEAALRMRQFRFHDADLFTEDTIAETVIEGNYHFLEKFSIGGAFMRNDYSERFVVSAGYSF